MPAVDVVFVVLLAAPCAVPTPVIYEPRFTCGAALEGRVTGVLELKAES